MTKIVRKDSPIGCEISKLSFNNLNKIQLRLDLFI